MSGISVLIVTAKVLLALSSSTVLLNEHLYAKQSLLMPGVSGLH